MHRNGSGLRVGYSAGAAKRLNERAIDGKWVGYLQENAEAVPLSPLRLFRMLGGSIERFVRDVPEGLRRLDAGLRELRELYSLRTLYVNVPSLLPFLMLGRAYGGADIGFLFLAHSIASESWLRQWIGIAPMLSGRDTLLCSSASAEKALRLLSEEYGRVARIPLCADIRSGAGVARALERRNGRRLLSIGRLEEVKNIDALLRIFARIVAEIPEARLDIAGEYTGEERQIAEYRQRLAGLVDRLGLERSVRFTGPVEGEAKEQLFAEADLLLNLSTDPGETFGYNLIEAKAWGVPSVCVNWNGFRDVVVHGEDGWLIDCEWDDGLPLPRFDEAKTAEAALRLLKDDAARTAMSLRAAERAGDFDYRAIFPRIVAEAVRAEKEAAPAAIGDEALRLLSMSPNDLPSLYRTENLRLVPFANRPLLDILSASSVTAPTKWMPAVQPLIGHYAGRVNDAEH